ncbi:MAG: TetR/AcrR family transcriptional regulator C-terminal domain-containing protein [Anaerolineaceae bacterium]|nr:TetR/AcrR family transcriptional regulator C-terminal domain-containing protein [Anaerolineaceae bacterium]
MARKMDRRVQRTRKLLRDALMNLIMEDGYDAISIQDITEKANLGRATFYLHFKDKDELLLDVMEQFIDDFMAQVPQITEAQWRLDDNKALVRLFDFAAEHYDLYRILIIGSGGITAANQLRESVADNIANFIQQEIDELDAKPVIPTDFIANHFAGSLLSTIYWWLDSDLTYTPEEMADMFQKVNTLDRKALMGVAPEVEEPEEDKGKKKRRPKEKTNPRKDKKDTKNAEAKQESAPNPDLAPDPMPEPVESDGPEKEEGLEV